MQHINEIPRIDKYTCKFENHIMEERFMAEKFNRIRKPINFAIIFFLLLTVGDALNFYIALGGFSYTLLVFPLFFSAYISYFFLPKTIKEKKFDLILCVLFLFYHFFQIYLMMLNPDALEQSGLSQKDILLFIPVLLLFIYILFPFSFIISLITVFFFFSTFIPMLINIQDASIIIWFFSIPIPLVLLTYNKYQNEYNSRSDFAKAISIEETKKLMQKTLKRYFGDILSEKMIKEGGDLDGENRWVSILFSDLSAYSTITEKMSPEVALEFLNEYFTKMHVAIKEFDGHILNYIGDSIMVVFGAPEKLKNHENNATLCAVKMKKMLLELNNEWDQKETSRYWKNHGIKSITMRIGIHTGSVIAGNLGSKEMLQYSTIGDTVNVASRLEQANKKFETEISFSQEIYTALKKELHDKSKLSGEITLKGRTTPTKVYTI